MTSNPKVQTIRFRGPTNVQTVPEKPPLPRHSGILQDQLRRAQRRPWTPSYSLAVRILFLVRVAGAMYSNISDCDEVFNFWEPLHFLDQGYGFQTWELSPQFAVRSWAYILLHSLPPRLGNIILPGDKRAAFFAVRILLAAMSVFAEVAFYRVVVERIHERVGRYLFFMLLFSAGMWSASTAFLPSSFAMYTSAFAFSYSFAPSSAKNYLRTLATTILFATGAIVGWPFSLALAIPFVFEELFIFSDDRVPSEVRRSWMIKRWKRLIGAGLVASLVAVPVVVIDSLAYGRFSFVAWNIIQYNIFGGVERGPSLYGTAPWNFYFNNLVLNFNILVPLALLSLPAMAVTYVVDRKRLGFTRPAADQSSPFTILGLRLMPFYLWLGMLSLQPHKEERFMFPAYPLLCFNAAVCVYLIRGWLEVGFVSLTKSPYRASQSLIFRNFTFSVVVGFMIISLSRVIGQWHYYHAPLTVMHALQTTEIPRLLNMTGLLPVLPHGTTEEEAPRIDLTPVKEFDLALCFGKEWHRFQGHYLVPNGIRVEFIKSEFDGLLPRHFTETVSPGELIASKWWSRPQTRYVPADLNDLNKEDSSHYVDVSACDYLIDVDFPKHPVYSTLEPRFAIMDEWERVHCEPFLDAKNSMMLTRIFWLPGEIWQGRNEFGDYCLLKNKALVARKEAVVAQQVKQNLN